MRVSDSLLYNFISSQNAALKEAVLAATSKAASGAEVSKPSDDPVKAAKIVQFDDVLSKLNATAGNLDTVQLDLTLADQILAEVVDVLGDVQALGVQAQNDTQSDTDRAAIGAEIAGLLTEILDLASTQTHDGRFLFGGVAEGTAAYDANGNYVGSKDVRKVEISPGVFVDASMVGGQAFGDAAGGTVFNAVQNLVDALEANDLTAIQDATGEVATALEDVLVNSATLGTRLSTLAATEQINQDLTTLFTIQKSEVQEVDLATQLTNLAAAENALQATTLVSQRLLATSLLSFLG